MPNNPNTPNINPSPTASTRDLSNGAISGNVTGGVAPYTYMWAGGHPSTPNLGNICRHIRPNGDRRQWMLHHRQHNGWQQ
ncbi:MAG: SprB repeat-containing protein [Lewinellaceae bacterium]|nr:SprB repeat-containing protein [Lewinellaceae bacterium]